MAKKSNELIKQDGKYFNPKFFEGRTEDECLKQFEGNEKFARSTIISVWKIANNKK